MSQMEQKLEEELALVSRLQRQVKDLQQQHMEMEEELESERQAKIRVRNLRIFALSRNWGLIGLYNAFKEHTKTMKHKYCINFNVSWKYFHMIKLIIFKIKCYLSVGQTTNGRSNGIGRHDDASERRTGRHECAGGDEQET
jgi:hypothetical protein